MDKATPRPWLNYGTTIYQAGKPVSMCVGTLRGGGESDTALIVKAVNSYDALLEACKEIVKYQRGAGPSKTLGEVVEIARQAIAQAETK